MHVLPELVTSKSILRVLLAGFGLVILLLLAAGFVALGTSNWLKRPLRR